MLFDFLKTFTQRKSWALGCVSLLVEVRVFGETLNLPSPHLLPSFSSLTLSTHFHMFFNLIQKQKSHHRESRHSSFIVNAGVGVRVGMGASSHPGEHSLSKAGSTSQGLADSAWGELRLPRSMLSPLYTDTPHPDLSKGISWSLVGTSWEVPKVTDRPLGRYG